MGQKLFRFKIIVLMAFLVALSANINQVDAADKFKPLPTLYNGNPTNYLTLLNSLQPGDTLLLAAGTYTGGLPISNLNGTSANPIIIAGPDTGPRPVFKARSCCNTVSIRDSSYIEIRNLELDGRDITGTKLPNVDAVKAEGDANWSHHITLENLYIHNHDANQQTVGISTKHPTWDWVIRNNIIDSAGTGMYLGNSDGSAHFINGLIEGNLFKDTIGYNVQIKHQTGSRPTGLGAPANGVTTIRHNVFSKANNASTGGNARPNLLVGHWPLSGNGSNDIYQIYGNFFYQNPSGEPLFQGEGNIALYDNLFVNHNGDAMWIQPHNDIPKTIQIFNNTVVSSGTGIYVTGGDPTQQQIVGNAAFAAAPISAPLQTQSDNVTDTYNNAVNYLVNPMGSPTGTPSQLDLYPLVGTLTGSTLDLSSFQSLQDWDRDFNGALRNGTFRGAYAGEGTNPGWLPKLERKPLSNSSITISGIISQNGVGVSGVTFSGLGLNCNPSDSSGQYTCFVISGWSGTITPIKTGFTFTPTFMSYTNVTTHTVGQDYNAATAAPPANSVYLPIVLK